ncbi:MAG: hypothetical protein Q7R95_11505 [bacterium]|nr:hypothetical protein [bacterium]
MLTKKDLASIQTIFKPLLDAQKKEIKDELKPMFENQKKEIMDEIKPMFTSQKKEIIGELISYIQKNTDELVDLITTGFKIQDSDHKKSTVRLDDHEYRIKSLEKKSFSPN